MLAKPSKSARSKTALNEQNLGPARLMEFAASDAALKRRLRARGARSRPRERSASGWMQQIPCVCACAYWYQVRALPTDFEAQRRVIVKISRRIRSRRLI